MPNRWRLFCGAVQSPKSEAQSPETMLRSPGLLKKHYSPQAKLLVLDWQDDADLKTKIHNLAFKTAGCFIIAHTRIPSEGNFADVSVMPHDAEAFARALYAELHRCDEAGATLIIVEAPPKMAEWSGIADRLKRAAS